MKFGLGTEKIEEELRQKFPQFAVRRMDSDAMRSRQDYREALEGLWDGETDAIVGTQMIAKGLDVPNVTVVGVISADTAFHLPDFRAAERTFQLITQVAGRAGRGPKGGTVVVQTFNPTHYAIAAAARHDFDGFVQREIAERKDLRFPPFTRLIRIVLSGANEPAVRKAAGRLGDRLKPELPELLVQMLGPAPAPIYRIKGRYRMGLLLKASDQEPARAAIRKIVPAFKAPRGVKVTVDVDPINMA
jgi:primosomal protein N' (replication factor Y)